jgi:hypothetical protein
MMGKNNYPSALSISPKETMATLLPLIVNLSSCDKSYEIFSQTSATPGVDNKAIWNLFTYLKVG